MAPRTRRLSLVIFALVIGALVVAGCGGSDKSTTTTATTASTTAASGVDAAVAKLVPAAVKSKGTLTAASDATYPPLESIGTDGKTLEGADVDLGEAIGKLMGVKVKFVNQTFDSIIPGLQAGKYGLGISSFTDTKEREKVVDFVTYLTAGTSFYEKTSGPDVEKLADLCGHSVAVEKGTTQQNDATAQSKKCKVTVHVFPDQTGANQALSSGRADIVMADTPPAAFAVNSVGRQVQAVQDVLRQRAVRDRDPQGQRHGAGGPRRGQGPDGQRPVRRDPQEVGSGHREDHQPDDQRSDELVAATGAGDGRHSTPHSIGCTARPDDIRAVPVRHYGRWLAAAIVVLIAGRLIYSVATNANFEWGTIGHFLFDHRILHGVVVTLELTVLSMIDRHPARRGSGGHAPVTQSADRRRELVLHLDLPRDPGPGPDPALVQRRRAVPADHARPAVHPCQRKRSDHPVRRRNARAGAQRGRLHGGDRPRGAAVGR